MSVGSEFTISDAYPTPLLADIIQEVENAGYESTTDAYKAHGRNRPTVCLK